MICSLTAAYGRKQSRSKLPKITDYETVGANSGMMMMSAGDTAVSV